MPAKDRRRKLDVAWKKGLLFGQRTVSGEYLVCAEEAIFRPRTIHRVPAEERWVGNLSFDTRLPWKLNEDHDGDSEVILDENLLSRRCIRILLPYRRR